MSWSLQPYTGQADGVVEHEFAIVEGETDHVINSREQAVIDGVKDALRQVVPTIGGYLSVSAYGSTSAIPTPGDTVAVYISYVGDPAAASVPDNAPIPSGEVGTMSTQDALAEQAAESASNPLAMAPVGEAPGSSGGVPGLEQPEINVDAEAVAAEAEVPEVEPVAVDPAAGTPQEVPGAPVIDPSVPALAAPIDGSPVPLGEAAPVDPLFTPTAEQPSATPVAEPVVPVPADPTAVTPEATTPAPVVDGPADAPAVPVVGDVPVTSVPAGQVASVEAGGPEDPASAEARTAAAVAENPVDPAAPPVDSAAVAPGVPEAAPVSVDASGASVAPEAAPVAPDAVSDPAAALVVADPAEVPGPTTPGWVDPATVAPDGSPLAAQGAGVDPVAPVEAPAEASPAAPTDPPVAVDPAAPLVDPAVAPETPPAV